MIIAPRYSAKFFSILLFCAMGTEFLFGNTGTTAPDTGQWQAGASKVDVTPKESVRLSGYGSRNIPTSEADTPLFVRALAMKHGEQAPMVIVSLDAIGLSATLTDRICERLKQKHGLDRTHLVLCSTHSHTAPHLEDVLPNLYSSPLTNEEHEHMLRYSQRLVEGVVQSVGEALARLEPASIEFGTGRANFAINRRLLKNKTWTGFGTVDDGPVDRTVRVVQAKRSDGKTIAVAYQYACHCTSVSPEFNRIGGDWAGLSSTMIEADFIEKGSAEMIALPIIGCGADANPNPRSTFELAVNHAKEMAESVRQVCSGSMTELPAPSKQAFQLVALASERPSREKLDEMAKSANFVERNFADIMLTVLKHKDRLPETYPAPVHYWSFGESLAWVFMGGEVVVDYQIRLERELSQFPHVWVAGYVDDVFAYVASERVRNEGGYEVDGSMLYYAQPGRWVTGTEDVIVTRVLEMAKGRRQPDQPLSATDSLRSIEMPKGWTIELVASEPLVEDPVGVAFDPDGSVWVVEMGDYPSGGGNAGRIKRLTDSDGDGQLDQSVVFLDNLAYPAGVYPWSGGVVVACAPEVFLALDTDGDGVADTKQVLLSGFPLANPQHRVNGFTYGLDGSLHMGVGAGAHDIVEERSGRTVNVSGGDIRLNLSTGRVDVMSGSTQYIRGCDNWGNWFGNDNSHPLFHYVWNRNWKSYDSKPVRALAQHAMQPPTAPAVFPISRSSDRFNDLFAANRFTSACSSIICRSPGATEEMQGSAIICESVHNLVSRIQLRTEGVSFRGARFDEDKQSEWIRSSDPWFRPVRLENAPDGTIWIVDMYRQVIEHPEWIPDDWQRRINVRAGDQCGRIYRAYRSDFEPYAMKDWKKASEEDLLNALKSPSSAVADIAMQRLIERDTKTSVVALSKPSTRAESPQVRIRNFAVLAAMGKISWTDAFSDPDDRVVRWAIERMMLDSRDRIDGGIREKLQEVASSTMAKDSPPLAFQLIVALMTCNEPAIDEIAHLLAQHAGDPWIDLTTGLLPNQQVDSVLQYLLDHTNPRTERMVDGLIDRASNSFKERLIARIDEGQSPRPAWHFTLAKQFALKDSRAEQVHEASSKRLHVDAMSMVQDMSVDLSIRQSALAFLASRLSDGDDQDLERLIDCVISQPDLEFSSAMMRAIAAVGPNASEKIVRRWKELSSPVRSTFISVKIANETESLRLLSSVEQGMIDADTFSLSQIEQLRSLDNREVQAKTAKLFGPVPGADRAAIAEDFTNRWPERIDVSRGETLYKQHCAQCHQDRVLPDGGTLMSIGPNLQSLSGWKNDAWMVGILDPNRAVEPKYRRLSIRTEDGLTVVGLKVREGEQSLELVNDSGQWISLERTWIEEVRESDRSLMPEGFERTLTPSDVASIVTYLRKQK